jgi:hypothetical protein
MYDCNWEVIEAFHSPVEFARFVRWIEDQVEAGNCEELLVPGKQIDKWADRRFRYKSTGEVWRLSHPDPGYFPGSWRPEAPSY